MKDTDRRERNRVSKGQKLYIISAGDTLIIKRVPENIPKRLQKLIGEFDFDRGVRMKTEEWFLKETRRQCW